MDIEFLNKRRNKMLINFFNLMDTNDTAFALVVGGIGIVLIGLCYLLDKYADKQEKKYEVIRRLRSGKN